MADERYRYPRSQSRHEMARPLLASEKDPAPGVGLGPGPDIMEKSETSFLVGNRAAIPRFCRPLPSNSTKYAVSGPYTKCPRADRHQANRMDQK